MNSEPTNPSLIPKGPPPAPSHAVRNLSLGIVLVVLIGGLAYGGWWASQTYSHTFYGAQYISGRFNDRRLNEIGFRGAHEVTLPIPGKLADYARTGDAKAAIVVSAQGGEDVYRITDASSTPVTHDRIIKSALDISSDGAILYAEHTDRSASSTASSTPSYFNPYSWDIIYVPVQGAPQRLGIGYAPHFFKRDGKEYVLYTAPKSIAIVDLASGTHQEIATQEQGRNGFFTAAVSPDGQYAALPTLSTNYYLFMLKSDDAGFSFVPVHALSKNTNILAFTADGALMTVNYPNNAGIVFSTSLPASVEDILHTRSLSFSLVQKLLP